MISLFIDTSTSRLIIGIYKDKKQIFFENEEAHNDLSSKVLPHIKNALTKVSLNKNDIDEIYVVNGPGSFTGTRIGVTIAKTLAWSLNIKIYVVSGLQLLATTHTSKKYIVPMIDARRNAVYAGMYNKKLKAIINDKYINADDLKKEINDIVSLDDIEFVSYDELDNALKPVVDIERLINNVTFNNINSHLVNPNYLKKTEAEEKLNDTKNK